MPTDVEKLAGLEHGAFMDILSDYLYESIGAAEFGRRHPLIEKSCVVVPSTAHISLSKAVTILGLGKNSLIPVAVDEESRMDAKGTLTQLRAYYFILNLCMCSFRKNVHQVKIICSFKIFTKSQPRFVSTTRASLSK